MDKICKIAKSNLPDTAPEAFAALVKGSSHFCRKCGRVANSKKRLCKPEKIRSVKDKKSV